MPERICAPLSTRILRELGARGLQLLALLYTSPGSSGLKAEHRTEREGGLLLDGIVVQAPQSAGRTTFRHMQVVKTNCQRVRWFWG